MKCDKCGFNTNPGDQICINCGAKLNLNNYSPEIVQKTEEIVKKDNKKVLIISIISVILGILFVFFFIKLVFFGFKMKNKLLVIVYVPLIEKEFNIYIPIVKKVGTIKNLIIKMLEEASDGTFVDDNCKKLYDKLTGEVINDELFVRDSNIRNGSKLILY